MEMLITKFNIMEWAAKFTQGDLAQNEKNEVLAQIHADPILKKEWDQSIELVTLLNNAGKHQNVKNQLAAIQNEQNNHPKTVISIAKNWLSNHIKPVAAAVALVFVTASTTYMFTHNGHEDKTINKFTQLNREIENIKSTQNKLESSIANTKEKENNFDPQIGGTGFAISNNGYIATSYHVVKNSNEISIITNNKTLPAYIVAFDPASDVAILKINQANFQFSKEPLPYSFPKQKSSIGLKIFTIGYPQDEIVYNEGYISCEKGFGGDTLSYQLEIVANPGQSGSPVIDTKGNIIGIITGKSSNTSGTTFANQTSSLINLINSLPEVHTIKINNKQLYSQIERVDQVKKYKNFVVSIKSN